MQEEGGSADHSFGSLTINSGGTYEATSGTTTIEGPPSGLVGFDIDGTFNHNSGTVNLSVNTGSAFEIRPNGSSFYNLNINNGNGWYRMIEDTKVENALLISFRAVL